MTTTATKRRPIRPGDTVTFARHDDTTASGIVWSLAPGGTAWIVDPAVDNGEPVQVKLPTPKRPDAYEQGSNDWRARLAALEAIRLRGAVPLLTVLDVWNDVDWHPEGGYRSKCRVWHDGNAANCDHVGTDRRVMGTEARHTDVETWRREVLTPATGWDPPERRGRSWWGNDSYRRGDTLCPACLARRAPVAASVVTAA